MKWASPQSNGLCVAQGKMLSSRCFRAPTREEKRMNLLFERMLRAAKLDSALYEEVEADRTTIGQAMAVVVISSVAAGIGNIGKMGFGGILTSTLGALLGWYVWALLTYYIGTRWLPEPQTRADVGELLRTTGFSSSPGVIRILGILAGDRRTDLFCGRYLAVGCHGYCCQTGSRLQFECTCDRCLSHRMDHSGSRIVPGDVAFWGRADAGRVTGGV